MKIENLTKWRTPELRFLANAVAEKEVLLTPDAWVRLKIVFHYRATTAKIGDRLFPGVAYVKLPQTDIDPIEVAKSLAWAIGAAIGVSRRDMKGIPRYQFDSSYWKLVWQVRDAIVREKPVKTKPSKPQPSELERLQVGLEMARNWLETWQNRLEKVCRKVTEWRKVVRSAERRLEKKRQELQTETPDSTPIALPPVETATGRKFRRVV